MNPNPLLETVKLGALLWPNRIVMAPMLIVCETVAHYHAQRANGY